jgi:hypothetical protein
LFYPIRGIIIKFRPVREVEVLSTKSIANIVLSTIIHIVLSSIILLIALTTIILLIALSIIALQ